MRVPIVSQILKIALFTNFIFGSFLALVESTAQSSKAYHTRQHIDSLNRMIRTIESQGKEKGELLCQLAEAYSAQENYFEAKKANLEALEIFRKMGDRGKSCKVLLDIGMIYDKENQYDQAFRYSFEALEILELLSDEMDPKDYNFKRGVILMNIGIIYGQVENSEKSLELLRKANELLVDSKPLYQAICHENLGNVYMEMSEHDQALVYFNKALTYYKKNKVQPTLVANTHNNIGNIYKATNQFDKALPQYLLALNALEGEEIYLSERIGVLSRIGDIYIDLDNLEAARRYLDSAMNLSTGTGGKRYIRDNYKSLVKLYSKQDNYQKAYENLEILKRIEDSLYEPEVLERIAKVQEDYDLKTTERENVLKIQLLEQEKALGRYNWYVVIAIGMVLFLLILLWYFKQKQKSELDKIALKNAMLEKQQMEDQIRFKNNQLTNYATYIVQKNEFLETIKLELDRIRSSSPDNNALKPLSRIVNQHLISVRDRKDFEVRIEKENQDFYYKLDRNFPELSDKNKKLCSLLLLELSSKEIATLLNISVGSVEKSRHRLRKKLNIPADLHISEFLNNM